MSSLGYITRRAEGHIRNMAQEYPCVTLCGPRQSGKTTLARHMFPHFNYVSLENPNERFHFEQDPLHFLQQYKAPTIFDEVQNTPQLLSYLQGIIDESGKTGMYILTGSRQMELQSAVSQSLAGRTAVVDLLPLSLAEMEDAGLHPSRDEALFRGCLPRVVADGLNPVTAYAGYLRTYVERDVRQLSNLRNLRSFELFIRLLASRVGQLVNYSALATEVGVSATAIKEWMSLLEASYIVYVLRPYYRNFGKRLIKTPKVYFTEPGLVTHLLGIQTPEQVGRDPLVGGMFENLVVMEALKARFNAGKVSDLYFYRDSSRMEVDLLVDELRHPRPIEIKSGSTYTPAMARNVKAMYQNAPSTTNPALIYAGKDLGVVDHVQVCSFLHTEKLIAGD